MLRFQAVFCNKFNYVKYNRLFVNQLLLRICKTLSERFSPPKGRFLLAKDKRVAEYEEFS